VNLGSAVVQHRSHSASIEEALNRPLLPGEILIGKDAAGSTKVSPGGNKALTPFLKFIILDKSAIQAAVKNSKLLTTNHA
jgi:hypothetical protein